MRKRDEPWRYKPGGYMKRPIDPKLCAASVHSGDRAAHIYQCTRPRVVGDWCKQHAPLKPTGALLWSTKIEHRFNSKTDEVVLSSVEVLKETPKQYKLAAGRDAFGYKTTLNKSDMMRGGRWSGAIYTDPRSALLWREDSLMRTRDNLMERLAETRAQLTQVAKLLDEHPEVE